MNPTVLAPIDQLLAIMARLRDPQGGCPWDVKQNFASVAPYTIEEAYEVADAIDRGDFDDLREELGDLLLQVVFHARMAEEAGHFAFNDVVAAICDKMIRRHPHVFGDAEVRDAAAQTIAWEAQKRDEKGLKQDDSVLAGISSGMPEWLRAVKLQKRAASVGFEWPDAAPILDKLEEEIAEVRAELARTDLSPETRQERLQDEIGDVLFVALNLARTSGVDPSAALRCANRKFEWRFRWMEQQAARQRTALQDLDLSAQEQLWREAKENQ
ncbi:nucleoside triphosphate pyrophosphohydrolase [Ahniella affigens]|uniref:Nucleoside triphosphate pyrophosphohydrolase n=2 Tax=Ahniella affigens TaxID=2021234 RepID=A0A2P1PYT0_9GAMM|nr:nucleoside triphosphate pyrophosphohydrolase [Ahniella affigens]AVP99998.1 nucleoside triphosphate pyrophosphohydrolase [Ahniella affigens]